MDFEEPMLRAMQMAQENLDGVGGPLGRAIEFPAPDSGTDSTQAVTAVEKLVSINGTRNHRLTDSRFGRYP